MATQNGSTACHSSLTRITNILHSADRYACAKTLKDTMPIR